LDYASERGFGVLSFDCYLVSGLETIAPV